MQEGLETSQITERPSCSFVEDLASTHKNVCRTESFNSIASEKEEFSIALAWCFQELDLDKIPLFYKMCWEEILAKRGENYLRSLASYHFKLDVQNMEPFEFYTYLQNKLPLCLQNQDVIDTVEINIHYSANMKYESAPPKINIKGDNLHLLEILESVNLRRYPRCRNYKFISNRILVTDGLTPFPEIEPNPLLSRIVAITHVSPSVLERIKKQNKIYDSDLTGINWRKLFAADLMGFDDEKEDLVVYDPRRKILIVVAEERSAMNLLNTIQMR